MCVYLSENLPSCARLSTKYRSIRVDQTFFMELVYNSTLDNNNRLLSHDLENHVVRKKYGGGNVHDVESLCFESRE